MVNSGKIKKVLFGIPASPGKAEGIAKIVFDASEALNEITENDILITPMTDPSFVVAMMKAKGIITDFGGLLCHAAIVSRELGKPCIVGTKNATKIIQKGQKILMDAIRGEVYIWEEEI
jgi:pyruvate,water dikinase